MPAFPVDGRAGDRVDLVWSGPEASGIANRDTGVVVRELFLTARATVLIAGYAVHQGRAVFKALAERMDREPGLTTRMFLDVHLSHHDRTAPSDLLRRFAHQFTTFEWPGQRLPHVYYDPRSLESDPTGRSCLHAKCVVADGTQAFISSANFTEAAQTRNIEVGVLIRSRAFAGAVVRHFEAMADEGLLQPIPLG